MNEKTLIIQKLDRRMSGHQNFKYRIEFPTYKFNYGTGPSSSYLNRTIAYNDFCRHLTQLYGFGPNVDDAYVYANNYEAPRWGFRPPSNVHQCTIYLADDEVRNEAEKLIVFMMLQRN